MEAIFWGSRGSIPAPISAKQIQSKVRASIALALESGLKPDDDIDEFVRTKLPFELSSTFGGNTSCLEIREAEHRVIFDMGSGLRELGQQLVAQGVPKRLDIMLTHLHWDHIQGFPFFAPAYFPNTEIRIWSCHKEVEKTLRRQHASPNFPVDYGMLGSNITYCPMNVGETVEIAGFEITNRKQIHHNDSYGYRISRDGKTIVYATDIEHRAENTDEITDCVAFFKDADLVIFDAMFGWGETQSSRQDWGHSSNVVGVDLCLMAKARHLCLFHHDPLNSDQTLRKRLDETNRYLDLAGSGHELLISSAYDGLVVEV